MNQPMFVWMLLLLAVVGLACSGNGVEEQTESQETREPEALSLFGQPLYPMNLDAEQRSELEDKLAKAQADFDEDPNNPENIVWLGRRLAYLWRYRDAIDVFTKGIEMHPSTAELYRHRGHRYITLRLFDEAIADLEKAAALVRDVPDVIEQDGAPNPAGQPRSTLHFNIWYHLGLAYYLNGDFENALRAYEECMKVSTNNDDSLVATSDWLYMTLRRLGREEEARAVLEPIQAEMEILENEAYQKRLLMYKGEVEPDVLLNPAELTELNLVTQGYGVANWYFVNGEEDRAKEILEKILEGSYWAAFGYIAAEADLRRMQ
jgi:tetratricopeptide (TPR) repeat protein